MLSTNPYKGVRDFYPEDMAVLNKIISVWKKTAESFGYSEYGASILEPTELYRAKTSEEIVNDQTYSFKDRGDRDVTLRPEMTPTVARMVAGKRRDFAFPLRWYSIPNVFRYEQPQRGRVREHWQFNVDIFGSNAIEADIEIISLAYQTMKAFGAKDEDFEIKINSRKLLQENLESKLIDKEMLPQAIRLIDRKDKMAVGEFEKEWSKVSEKPFEMKPPKDSELKSVIEALEKSGITNVVHEPTVVRGFDYYTGIVFEVNDTNPENKRALFGGGRYDNLTANFLPAQAGGGDPIPAVGFGMGDVTIRDFLEVRNLLPKYEPKTRLHICIQDEKFRSTGEKLASDLREQGVAVALDISKKKVGDQIKIADKNKVPFITVIGESEAKSKEFKIKELQSGEETSCSAIKEIIALVQ